MDLTEKHRGKRVYFKHDDFLFLKKKSLTLEYLIRVSLRNKKIYMFDLCVLFFVLLLCYLDFASLEIESNNTSAVAVVVVVAANHYNKNMTDYLNIFFYILFKFISFYSLDHY